MIISLCLAGLFLILSVLLLSGRGSWLIAGYNTASAAQKAKYDEKKLCRAVGVLLLFCTADFTVVAFFHSPVMIIGAAAAVFVAAAVGIVYTNTKCRKPVLESARPDERESDRKNRRKNQISMAIVAVMVLVVGIIVGVSMLNSTKPPVYKLDSETLAISTDFGETIRLSDITGVELKNSLPGNLSRTNGLGMGNILRGTCSSDLGTVKVYIDSSIPAYIYIRTTSGLTILNDRTAEDTTAFYGKLIAAARH